MIITGRRLKLLELRTVKRNVVCRGEEKKEGKRDGQAKRDRESEGGREQRRQREMRALQNPEFAGRDVTCPRDGRIGASYADVRG